MGTKFKVQKSAAADDMTEDDGDLPGSKTGLYGPIKRKKKERKAIKAVKKKMNSFDERDANC